MSSRIIIGLDSISAYDDFVSEIKAMGVDDVLAAYQAAYNRYIAR